MDRLRALPSTPIEVEPRPWPTDGEDAEAGGVEGAEPVDPGVAGPAADRGACGAHGADAGSAGTAGCAGSPDGGATVVDVGVVGRPAPSAMDVVRDEERCAILGAGGVHVCTEYRGESAVFEGAGNRLNLTGDSRVAREGSAIETDSLLVYSGDVGMVCGYGNPVLSGDQDPVESDRVCYDIDRGVGMAERARTTFVQGGTWYVRGPENRVFL
jgi:hypothetical protein